MLIQLRWSVKRLLRTRLQHLQGVVVVEIVGVEGEGGVEAGVAGKELLPW